MEWIKCNDCLFKLIPFNVCTNKKVKWKGYLKDKGCEVYGCSEGKDNK